MGGNDIPQPLQQQQQQQQQHNDDNVAAAAAAAADDQHWQQQHNGAAAKSKHHEDILAVEMDEHGLTRARERASNMELLRFKYAVVDHLLFA